MIEENMDKAIIVWPYHDAPQDYQKLSTSGGDEDWLAFVPQSLASSWIGWLDEGSNFGPCDVETIGVDGGVIKIGSHA